MPRARPDPFRLQCFYDSLPILVASRLSGPEARAYDHVLYTVAQPYRPRDIALVLAYARAATSPTAVPPATRAQLALGALAYPRFAGAAPAGLDAGAWSAVLHFHDPSYPLDTPAARAGLRSLGFDEAEGDYPGYVAVLDQLKERAPASAVPETHWFLARLLQAGLEAWVQVPERVAGHRVRAPC